MAKLGEVPSGTIERRQDYECQWHFFYLSLGIYSLAMLVDKSDYFCYRVVRLAPEGHKQIPVCSKGCESNTNWF